jgi:hypothetical protein
VALRVAKIPMANKLFVSGNGGTVRVGTGDPELEVGLSVKDIRLVAQAADIVTSQCLRTPSFVFMSDVEFRYRAKGKESTSHSEYPVWFPP